MRYLKNIWNAFSQLLNVALLGGHPNESISGRCHREPWPRNKRVVNTIFYWQKDHCKSSYTNDIKWAEEYLKQDKEKT